MHLFAQVESGGFTSWASLVIQSGALGVLAILSWQLPKAVKAFTASREKELIRQHEERQAEREARSEGSKDTKQTLAEMQSKCLEAQLENAKVFRDRNDRIMLEAIRQLTLASSRIAEYLQQHDGQDLRKKPYPETPT